MWGAFVIVVLCFMVRGGMKRDYLNPAPPESNKAKHKFSANRGQGTKSLAGAGRSPQTIAGRQFPPTGVYEPHISKPPGLRSTTVRRLFADRRTRTQHKQNESSALIRVKGRCPLRVRGGARRTIAVRHSVQPNPNSEKQTKGLRFIAVRQSPPLGENQAHKSKPSGLRFTAVRRSFAFVQYSFLCVYFPVRCISATVFGAFFAFRGFCFAASEGVKRLILAQI